jgi:multidrug transporter EmrE-like cation transporter
MGAAALAVGLEYCYRTLPVPWSNAWYFTFFLIAQCAIGISIYKLVNTPGVPLIGAFVIWSFSTIIMRTIVSVVFLGDKISPGTWCAVALLLLARVAQSFWK